MRPFSKISHALWQSERYHNLPSDEGRYLYIYLLTSSHQTSAGAYRLPDGYACEDLRWPLGKYRLARDQLVAADFIHFDDETSVVMITRWFKHNPPMNDSHLKSIEGELSRLPSEPIAEAAYAELVATQEAIEAEKQEKAARKRKPLSIASNGLGGAIPDRLATAFLNRGRQ
jgi:hypothetical protein